MFKLTYGSRDFRYVAENDLVDVLGLERLSQRWFGGDNLADLVLEITAK